MLLQRIIAQLVMLAILFTVTMSSASALVMPVVDVNSPASHCQIGIVHAQPVNSNSCCEILKKTHTTGSHGSDMGEMNHCDHCCDNSDCHNISSVPFAILTDSNTLLTPSSTQLFTEPDGEQYHFHELILRPPMSA